MRNYKVYPRAIYDQIEKDLNPDNPLDQLLGDPKDKRIEIRVSHKIWSSFTIRAGIEGVSLRNLASEAIMYWCYSLAKEAFKEAACTKESMDEYIEVYRLWRELRNDRVKNKKGRSDKNLREKTALSRKGWHRLYPGEPWPGIKVAGNVSKIDNVSKGDVQLVLPL